ncbi:hypothetical protein [Pontixanthobacter gangjinensis]|uniref:Lipoprotein n=1 Tax=Pontixanthobacter gangjinensis TaxID=1028742 RepID=A0A6I4SND5_9SPHN|nr:hypothetical protein [Pontixanthobacter gangjinensis]MXO57431.1 hypothetical protein [Pontixanthobacter gangjinensis]
MLRNTSFLLAILPATILGGCASSGKTYPSLAIRDAEQVSGSLSGVAEDSEDIAPAPLSDNIAVQLPELESGARKAHLAFTNAVPAARSAVARGSGAATASDNWARAQVALGDLDSLRSQTAVFLGDLDLLYVDATLAFEQREAIGQVRNIVIGLVAEEDAELSKLRD